jgi:hypothetical protein
MFFLNALPGQPKSGILVIGNEMASLMLSNDTINESAL